MARCPFAQWDPVSGDLGNFDTGPYKIVHHTTEGATYNGARAAYSTNRSDPHFTVDATAIYQHIDTARVARSLQHAANGVHTNRSSAIQIEIVAYAGRAKDPVALTNVARLCRWIEQAHNIPQSWPSGHPQEPVNGADPGGHNRDVFNWTTASGHYGHSQVPDNIHWDPGYTAGEVAIVTPQG